MIKLFILLLSLTIIACDQSLVEQNVDKDSPTIEDNIEENNNKCSITIKNKSQFDVNIYIANNHPYYGEPNLTIAKFSQVNYEFEPILEGADVFYFQYLIEIGDTKIPYFAYEQSKTLTVKKDNTSVLIIDEIENCPTNSAYLIVENLTTNQLYLKSGNSIKIPFNHENQYIPTGRYGLYEISENIYSNSNSLTFESFSMICITNGIKEYSFAENIEVKKGNVYTFVCSDKLLTLKSVSPFDIETKNKIWNKTNLDSIAFYVDNKKGCFPMMRARNDLNKGFVISGTMKSDSKSISFLNLDVYGNEKSLNVLKFADSENRVLERISVLDFIEDYDGSYVFLLRRDEKDENTTYTNHILIKYDFSDNSLSWSFNIENEDGVYLFRNDSRGKIISIGNDKYCFAGGYFRKSTGTMHHTISLLDCTGDSIIQKKWINTNGSDYINLGIEELLTSAWFDGTNIFVCGYMFDFNYSNSQKHKSIVYKFDKDLTFLGSIYEINNCLLFGINGNNTDKWFCCGEYTDMGTILKGCFIDSTKTKNEKPICYVSPRSYSWFTQLCLYDNNIILSGQSSNNLAGTDSSIPIIAAFNKNGILLWENTAINGYTTTLNCIPNSIGTYIVQIFNSKSNTIGYGSADLLGNL